MIIIIHSGRPTKLVVISTQCRYRSIVPYRVAQYKDYSPSYSINCNRFNRCYRKKETNATAKITWIRWGGSAKATWAPRAAPSLIFRRSIEQVSQMLTERLLGKAVATTIAKLETDTVATNDTNNRRATTTIAKVVGLCY